MNSLEADKVGRMERAGEGGVCTGGTSIMSRKDSDFPEMWNRGYDVIRRNGQLKKLCQRARDVHGNH